MKKYLVIGNPINHSLSPKLHNYWFKENNIDAVYEKKQVNEIDLEKIISDIRNGKIDGINVTVPFKKSVIPFLDKIEIPEKTQSVNTIYIEKTIKGSNKIIGKNTDILGFKYSLERIKYNPKGKKIFILGAGGVTSSIIFALEQMEVSTIMLSNRTREKAENLKKLFPQLELINWGEVKSFDIIINATSLGLKTSDKLPFDVTKSSINSVIADIIMQPEETELLKYAKSLGRSIHYGKYMIESQIDLVGRFLKLW